MAAAEIVAAALAADLSLADFAPLGGRLSVARLYGFDLDGGAAGVARLYAVRRRRDGAVAVFWERSRALFSHDFTRSAVPGPAGYMDPVAVRSVTRGSFSPT